MIFECGNCDRRFYSDHAIESHCRATGHSRIWYCDPCDREFRSEDGLENHLLYSAAHAMQHDCLDCGRNFRHRWRWYCELCDREFNTEDGLEQHCYTAIAHRTCNKWDRVFDTVPGYENHCAKSMKHRQPERANQSMHCHLGDRVFKSPSAYAQHVQSGVHNVSRHNTTRAAHSLRATPPVTLPMQFNTFPPSTPHINLRVDERGANVPAASRPAEAGPPLREEELAAATGAAVPGPSAHATLGPR
ncbi:hypothetical protein BKA70DRAFT_1343012 [Coprinopsis sp. MPI-PUGE-AT-0042]|nr:hypothetical protein BKA70DRAFT_1343012 [Coprinopsis sp. MPI-PUGE-AT-0042]